MKYKRKFRVKYSFSDNAQDHQKRLDNAFDYLFYELDIFETEHEDIKSEYEEQPTYIQNTL